MRLVFRYLLFLFYGVGFFFAWCCVLIIVIFSLFVCDVFVFGSVWLCYVL